MCVLERGARGENLKQTLIHTKTGMELYTAIVIGILGIVGGFVGLKWVQTRGTDPHIVNKKLRLYEDYIKDLEHDLKKYKGKANQAKQLPKMEVTDIPTDQEGLQEMADNLLPSLAQNLPKEIGSLLMENKGAIVDFVAKNPEIIQRFVTKRGSTDQSTSSGNIPEFDLKNAV